MNFGRKTVAQVIALACLATSCADCADSSNPARPMEPEKDGGGWTWNEPGDGGAGTGDGGGPVPTSDATNSAPWDARPCVPGEQPCTSADFPVCQYVETVGEFRCFAGGEAPGGGACEVSDDWTGSCSAGTHCVAGTDEPRCARLCDPTVQNAVNCPYGCKPGSDFGLGDPTLGFCVVPVGQTCRDEPRAVAGECDVFAQNCGRGLFCDVVIVGGSQPFEFTTACLPDDGEHTQGAKQPCNSGDGADCAPGLKCHEPTDTCRFLCRPGDGLGCTEGEFCADSIGNGFGLGMCQPGSCQL